MENVKVTVWLSTYNQEPYVAQALDSILMQKTDFPFEIVAADDCSTDRTQEIILDYQKRYPGKIVTFFPEQNLGGCRKLTGCIDAGLFRGEYLSFLEGDDYWLGEDRLQTLVEFLETHPEYSRVAHRRKVAVRPEILAAKQFDGSLSRPVCVRRAGIRRRPLRRKHSRPLVPVGLWGLQNFLFDFAPGTHRRML